MHPDEAISLVRALGEISESSLFVKMNKWRYPMSQEARILADLFDAFIMANSKKKKNKPYPRPFKMESQTKIGGTPISVEEAKTRYAFIQKNLDKVIPIL